MTHRESWNNRLKAIAFGLGLALTALTVRHWYGTFYFGYPQCENCRPDFPSLYSGAKLIWEKPGALYDLGEQLAIQKSIDSRIGDSVLAFAYPPTTALLLAPLGWTSFSKAYLMMTLVNAVALVVALYLLTVSLQLNRDQSTWLVLTTFCSFAVHSSILQGQTSLIILLLLVLIIRSSLYGTQAAAGLWSGALSFKPQLLPIPFLVLLAQRRWRGLALGIFIAALLAVFSGLIVGWEGIADYLLLARRFSAAESDLGTNPADMHNLRALVYYVSPPSVVTLAWFGLCALVAAGTVLLNVNSPGNERGRWMQWIGNLLAIILLSPHLHAHDLTLLIPASALFLKLGGEAVPVSISLVLVGLAIFPLLPWVLERHLPPVLPVILSIALTCCVWATRKSADNTRSMARAAES